MRLARFVRTLPPLLILGLAGIVLGCSGGGNPTPPDQEGKKAIGADMKAAHLEEQAARGKAAQQQKGGRTGRGPQ
jgi:hypothetical protein